MIRSQTLLVVLVVLLVIQWHGQQSTPAEAEDRSELMLAARPDPIDLMIVPELSPSQPPTEPPVPNSTPEPELALPTETAESDAPAAPVNVPESTARPQPPDTGQQQAVVLERGESGRTEVAFTFDAGAGVGYTSEILDLLAVYDAVGTFGITGEWVEANPELTRRIVGEGHMIINHSWDHASFTGVSTQTEPLTRDERSRQVEKTEAIVAEVADGYETQPYFRFPYGDYDRDSLDLLGEIGYAYTIWWSCDTLGWMGFSPAEISARCGPDVSRGGPGAILLMHVAEETDWRALEPLIRAYLEAGYSFVTIEQLIQP